MSRAARSAWAAVGIALALTGIAPCAASNATDDWAMADDIVARIEQPRIPDVRFPITAYGARADGSDARPAIQAAIAAAAKAGGGRVVIPAGTWLSQGPIHLRSKIDLHLEAGATLRFSPAPEHYLPTVPTRWEGTEMQGYSPLIYAAEVEDVAITGSGTIDGNADSGFLKWLDSAGARADTDKLRRMGVDGTPAARRVFGAGSHLRPPLIQFFRAKRVLLADYTATESPFWVNHLVYTEHATVRGVKVVSHHGNNDGVDVDSSRFVLIEDCHFRTGNDAVVVKSGRDRDGRDVGKPSEYIVVRRNDMGGEDGIALGSEMSGDIRHVFFSDNLLRTGGAAVRFKANLDRGGTVEHIRVRNFKVESFQTLIQFQLDYPGLLGGGHPSTYRDIVLENFDVDSAGIVFLGHAPAEAPLRGVTLRNFKIGRADRIADMVNVEGLQLENVTVGGRLVKPSSQTRPTVE
jgi:polygalacturonase